MKSTYITLFSLLLLLGLAGCSSTTGGKGGEGLDEASLDAARESRFGEGSIPHAEGEGIFRDIQFEYDSAQLTDEGRQSVEYNSQVLRDRSGIKVQLEGHTDERGTAEYNLALGQERAKTVREALAALGVARDRLEVISYGEEVPLDPSSDEVAWSKNRRVHFSGYSGALR